MKSSVTTLLASASIAAAHMEMTWPPPFRSKYNPYSNPGSIDYTMTAPLLADGSNFPCKNYQTADLGTPQGRATATFAAGQAANLTIGGGAPHGGGSCQVSLSYDRGRSFTVVQSIEGGCPASAGTTSINFAIPYDAPQGDVLLAWSWFNNLGNREMYMNCAAVTISGSASKREADGEDEETKLTKRAAHIPLNSRPKLFVANVGNGCTTVDSRDVKFPQPGPDLNVQSSQGAVPPVGSGCQSGSVAGSQTGDDDSTAPDSADSAKSAQNSGGVFVTVATSAAFAASTHAPVVVSAAPAPATAPSAAAAPPDVAGPPAVASSASAAHNANPIASVPVAKGSHQPAAAEIASATADSTSAAAAFPAGAPCANEGQWNCILGGKSFQRCASGRWSAIQHMAAGTKCNVGQSDRFNIEAENESVPAASRSRLRQLRRRGWRAAA
ncbi:hypothetical protein SEUCBS139899_005998 [Sporothrix eucalyptigena]|uniref:Extracellular protein n=1 Tax=Sporothrix eucalyptigena TaxID=1812306 RepID=A0ABP0CVR4_9PEZI